MSLLPSMLAPELHFFDFNTSYGFYSKPVRELVLKNNQSHLNQSK